jgi:predicted transcriptional regulator
MPKNLTIRLDDDLAADTEALARADDNSLNETVERRQKDPAFRRRVRQIIEQDRELLERLAR